MGQGLDERAGMNAVLTPHVVTTREFMEIQIQHIKDLLAEKDSALRLQALEYSRRLDELNHAHERAELAFATFLRRDIYDQHAMAAAQAVKLQSVLYDQKFDKTEELQQHRDRDAHARMARHETQLARMHEWQARVVGIVIGINAILILLARLFIR